MSDEAEAGSDGGGQAGDPLEDLERDKEKFERERLRDALDRVVEIDHETGDPIFFERYDKRGNREKFVTLLLYRAALVRLGHVEPEEQARDAEHFADVLPVAASTVQGYASDLGFVESDGGYLVPDHGIPAAIDYLGDTGP